MEVYARYLPETIPSIIVDVLERLLLSITLTMFLISMTRFVIPEILWLPSFLSSIYMWSKPLRLCYMNTTTREFIKATSEVS